MIALKIRAGGICLPVKVQPGARRIAIVGEHAGALKISVQATPEQGKASLAVIELLAAQLSLPHGNIEQISGATSREKQFLVAGIELDEFQRRIAACCPTE